MPIEPIENQTAYAKSNIIKGIIISPTSPTFPCPHLEQILRKGSNLLANAQLGPPTLCRQCALSQQNLSKGKLRQRKRGPRMPKVQKENLMNSVVELGSVFPSNSHSILNLLAAGGRSKLCDHARCAASRRTPCRPLLCRGRRLRQTLLLLSFVRTERKWRTWRIVGLQGLVASPPTVSALRAR